MKEKSLKIGRWDIFRKRTNRHPQNLFIAIVWFKEIMAAVLFLSITWFKMYNVSIGTCVPILA